MAEQKTRKVTYTGPEAEVTLAPDAGGFRFLRGEPVEVPEELAERLLARPEFRPRAPAKGSAARTRPDVETR